jgi:hypothetical protein
MDTYTVQRSVTIRTDAARVLAHLSDFHRWRSWSPWEGLDPHLVRTFEGAESGVGARYRWRGNRKAGSGRMEITDATSSQLRIRLDFEKPFRSSNTTTFTLRPAAGKGIDGTEVTWTMVGPRTRMLKVMGVFTSMDKMVGRDFEKGLAQLKSVAEAGG